MPSSGGFDRAFQRYLAEGALPIDRVAKITSIVMWTATVCKQLAHGMRWEATLGMSCVTAATLLLAASCWRRSAYVAHARWLTAGMVVWSHLVAAFNCVSGHKLLAGSLLRVPSKLNADLPQCLAVAPTVRPAWFIRKYADAQCMHSDNAFRFLFIQMVHNVGLFQALAALNSWPLLGLRFLLPVQLFSVASMAPRLRSTCRTAVEADEGASRMFAATSWALRQVFSLVDTGPPWAPSSRAVHEAECLQVQLWWLLLCCAASTYTCWLREQKARERFARQLGPPGEPHLRRMLHRHPLYSHHRPVLLVAIELYAMAAILWEALCTILPGMLLLDTEGSAGSSSSSSSSSIAGSMGPGAAAATAADALAMVATAAGADRSPREL